MPRARCEAGKRIAVAILTVDRDVYGVSETRALSQKHVISINGVVSRSL